MIIRLSLSPSSPVLTHAWSPRTSSSSHSLAHALSFHRVPIGTSPCPSRPSTPLPPGLTPGLVECISAIGTGPCVFLCHSKIELCIGSLQSSQPPPHPEFTQKGNIMTSICRDYHTVTGESHTGSPVHTKSNKCGITREWSLCEGNKQGRRNNKKREKGKQPPAKRRDRVVIINAPSRHI